MKIKLVFDDWRSRQTGVDSIYSTPEGVALSLGQFHSGTTFDAEVNLDDEDSQELEDALKMGHVPVFRVSLP